MARIAFEEMNNAREVLSGLAVCSFSTPGETDVLIRFFREKQPAMGLHDRIGVFFL